jgi:hypothetical protein
VHGQFQPGLGTGQGIAHFQQKIKGIITILSLVCITYFIL